MALSLSRILCGSQLPSSLLPPKTLQSKRRERETGASFCDNVLFSLPLYLLRPLPAPIPSFDVFERAYRGTHGTGKVGHTLCVSTARQEMRPLLFGSDGDSSNIRILRRRECLPYASASVPRAVIHGRCGPSAAAGHGVSGVTWTLRAACDHRHSELTHIVRRHATWKRSVGGCDVIVMMSKRRGC